MCGHAVIALGRYAIDYKLVKPVSPETQVKIQCPCGLVTAHVEYDAKTGKTGHTRFESIPAFAFVVNQTIQVGESQPNITAYMYLLTQHVNTCYMTTCSCMSSLISR